MYAHICTYAYIIIHTRTRKRSLFCPDQTDHLRADDQIDITALRVFNHLGFTIHFCYISVSVSGISMIFYVFLVNMWVCLKISENHVPRKTQWFCWSLSLWKMANKWLFHWGYTPFSDIPMLHFPHVAWGQGPLLTTRRYKWSHWRRWRLVEPAVSIGTFTGRPKLWFQ